VYPSALRRRRAARELAEQQGWEAVTTRRLAERIEYSQPVLYSHFRGKREIIGAVALQGATEIAAAVRAATAAADGPRARVYALARAYLDFAERNPAVYDAIFQLDGGLAYAQEETPEPLKDAFAARLESLGELAGDGVAPGLFLNRQQSPVRSSGVAGPVAETAQVWRRIDGNGHFQRAAHECMNKITSTSTSAVAHDQPVNDSRRNCGRPIELVSALLPTQIRRTSGGGSLKAISICPCVPSTRVHGSADVDRVESSSRRIWLTYSSPATIAVTMASRRTRIPIAISLTGRVGIATTQIIPPLGRAMRPSSSRPLSDLNWTSLPASTRRISMCTQPFGPASGAITTPSRLSSYSRSSVLGTRMKDALVMAPSIGSGRVHCSRWRAWLFSTYRIAASLVIDCCHCPD
jgi:AcrR family transcriptional regulator